MATLKAIAKCTGRTLNLRRESKRSLALVREEHLAYTRPRARRDCEGQHRPCPFVTCRHHLFLEVKGNGNIKLNHGAVELEQLVHTCSLDVASARPEGLTQDEVGLLLNLARNRVQQIEESAVRKLIALGARAILRAMEEPS